MRRAFVPFVWGALFGVGLLVSGMTQPSKVMGFLDVAGDWDPSLAFVMAGALLTFIPLRILIQKARGVTEPVAETRYDARLFGGAALFGAGWGLAGYCPGPALVAVGAGSLPALVVLGGLLGGISLADLVQRVAPVTRTAGVATDACSS